MMTETAVVKYDITEAAVAEMEKKFMKLTISDLENKAEFMIVHEARMVVKNHRVAVEKKRKELKADALAWGKKVDTEAKRIFGMLEPIESHLMAEENKVIEAEKRIKEEQDRIEREKIQVRVNSLGMFNVVLPFQEVAQMGLNEFENLRQGAEEAWEAEQQRKADEEAARKAEEERLAAERAELERQRKEQEEKDAAIRAEQEEAQKKIDAANKKIADEKAAIAAEMQKANERRVAALKRFGVELTINEVSELSAVEYDNFLEDSEAEWEEEQNRLVEEAAEQAKIKAKKEAFEAAEKAAREHIAKVAADSVSAITPFFKAEAERQEALKPDKERLIDFADDMLKEPAPKLKDEAAKKILIWAVAEISRISGTIKREVEKL